MNRKGIAAAKRLAGGLTRVAGAATAAAIALGSGLAAAHAQGTAGWCGAKHLSLSAATDPRSVQTQAGGAVLWFLQIRHHGPSACMVERRLILLSDHAASGASVKLHGYESAVFGGEREPLLLRDSERAFVELWYASPVTLNGGGGCHDNVVLTFGLSNGRGKLSARPPDRVAQCPGSLGISRTISPAQFRQLIQQ